MQEIARSDRFRINSVWYTFITLCKKKLFYFDMVNFKSLINHVAKLTLELAFTNLLLLCKYYLVARTFLSYSFSSTWDYFAKRFNEYYPYLLNSGKHIGIYAT
jgi:hypothetical protein